MLLLSWSPHPESPKKWKLRLSREAISRIKLIVEDRIRWIQNSPDLYKFILDVIYHVKQNNYWTGEIDWALLGKQDDNAQIRRFFFWNLGNEGPFWVCFTDEEWERLSDWIYEPVAN